MWIRRGSIWYYQNKKWNRGWPLAMFDFDGTLVPHRGRGPPAELSLAFLSVYARLGHNIVIISNRSSAKSTAMDPIKKYVSQLEARGHSCDVYAATARDRYRKPCLGIWDLILGDRLMTDLTPQIRRRSSYCGDAAGRVGDFSASDRNFARNIGVRFRTPEKLFGWHNCVSERKLQQLGSGLEKSHPKSIALEKELLQSQFRERVQKYQKTLLESRDFDVVLLVGSPASGKSTFAKGLKQRGFTIVGQDLQGRGKYIPCMLDALKREEPVVIDNTHPTMSLRKAVIDKVREGYPEKTVAIVWMTTSLDVCMHLDGHRCDLDTTNNTSLLPRLAFYMYRKRLEAPTEKEADRLIKVDFAHMPGVTSGPLTRRYGW
jgi:bifunctional polynucleotide phosphatase/kinase